MKTLVKKVVCLVNLSIALSSSNLFASSLDGIEKPIETDSDSAAEDSPQKNEPQISPVPKQTDSKQSADSFMHFKARPVANMATGFHITDEGYRATCSDEKGVVAQAEMNSYSVINGEWQDPGSKLGGSLKTTVLRPFVKFLRKDAIAGTCTFKVCLAPKDAEWGKDFMCDPAPSKLQPGPDYPATEINEEKVPFTVTNGDIYLTTSNPKVSGYHLSVAPGLPDGGNNDFLSPLVIDLSSSQKINLTSAWSKNQKVTFDLSGREEKVRTGWIAKGTALLALDINRDGLINSGMELFGEFSAMSNSQDKKRWDNGFLALAQYDSNRDGKIDQKDEIYERLVLWQDLNLNGMSEYSELKTLRKSGIESLSLAYSENITEGDYTMIHGNQVRYSSYATRKNGQKLGVHDVWFAQRPMADKMFTSR